MAMTCARVIHVFEIVGGPLAETMTGNGLRRVQARELHVTTYPDQPLLGFIEVQGRRILRDGTLSTWQSIVYTINPASPWDQSAAVPEWARLIAEPLIGGEL